ncbi:hypothetical protein FQN60_014466, partial [Etheostoma spectabile]
RSSTVAALAHHYGVAHLSVNAEVTEVLINGTSPVSLTARQLCDCAAAVDSAGAAFGAAAAAAADEAAQTTEPGPATHLEASDPAAHSARASHDTVEVLAKPSEDSGSRNDSKATEGGGVNTLSNLLPEQLLVDILAERFLRSDCHRGIVIDGLESVYTKSEASTLQVVLKALNNRKHIYVVNLSDSYAALKARERTQRETEEALQKERADREEQWLQELDDDEYDALPEEAIEHIVHRDREKRRQQKLRDLEHKSKEQKEKKQEEMKRLREEGKKDTKDMSKKKTLLVGKQSTDQLDGRKISSSNNSKKTPVNAKEQNVLNKVPYIKEAENSQTEEINAIHAESPQSMDDLEKEKSIEDELQSQFTVYEQSQDQVEHILQNWDRAQGLLLVPLPTEEAPAGSEDATTEKSPIGRKTKKTNSKIMSPMPSQIAAPDELDKGGGKVSPLNNLQDFIPHIVLNVTGKDYPSATELLKGSTLPSLVEVLEDLGLGPSGPPIPPPTSFSMVPFPKNREQSNSQLTCNCFTFLVPSLLCEQGAKKKDARKYVQASVAKDEAAATLSKSHTKESIRESAATKDKEKKGRESQKSKRQTSDKTKTKVSDRPSSPPLHISSTSGHPEPDQHQGNSELKRNQRQGTTHAQTHYKDTFLTTFRWIVPANGEVILKIWFYSASPGKFEQTFNFEILGTQRHYQLFCKGICTYPSICKDYMTLFALSKKNMERLVIHNNSELEAEVQFSFQHDSQATTYLLEPPTMTLNPDQKQELAVWAYPTKLGQMKDSIVCSIKNNPELVIINVSCWGVRPELELESKHLHFDRTLLHRQESRSVTMHNRTALPVSWRLQGVEELGDEFSLLQEEGIISANSSFPLSLHFRSRRPLNVKKILRLEVIEPKIRNGGEPIAILAIKVSVKAVFSRYKITPACDIDFGPVVYGSKKSQSFTIENNGVFDSRFIICRMTTDPAPPGKPGCPGSKILQEGHSERPTGASSKMRRESLLKDMNNTLPGSHQVVTVDCVAEQLGIWNQGLLIDISDRDPSDQPDGIPYRLLAEVCKPGIALDMASVFEEHHLCHSSSQLSSEQFCSAESIYVQDENKFIFNKVLVRRTAEARFKLYNNSKVPCVLNLAIKSVATKMSRSVGGVGVFDLSATNLSIPSQSHMFAVVTFTPQAMQQYSAVFEVTMDVISRMTSTFKSKVLEFDIVGEGTLPSVCVVRPALRNSRGNPILQFKQVMAGRRHTRLLVLLNDGNVPAQLFNNLN